MCCEAHANRNRARFARLMEINDSDVRAIAAQRRLREAELDRVCRAKIMEALLLQANARWDIRTLQWEPVPETMVIDQPTKVEAPVAKELVLA